MTTTTWYPAHSNHVTGVDRVTYTDDQHYLVPRTLKSCDGCGQGDTSHTPSETDTLYSSKEGASKHDLDPSPYD